MNTLADFTKLVKLCIEAAEAKFGKLPNIEIRYDLKGRAAGQAGRRAGVYFVRFNKEAMQVNWEHMVQETIPHEIAHIVAFAMPQLGATGHNSQWRAISQTLGCKGARCHTMKLTPAKRRDIKRFVYEMDGKEFLVGPKHHNLIQRHGKLAGIRLKSGGGYIDRGHFKAEKVYRRAA
jgi:predicted SprT family Zn-dependent metalloprotease